MRAKPLLLFSFSTRKHILVVSPAITLKHRELRTSNGELPFSVFVCLRFEITVYNKVLPEPFSSIGSVRGPSYQL